jgi:hypothetical protein
MNKYSGYGLMILLLYLIQPVQAQYNYGDRLRLEIAPYVWLTTMNGDLTISGQPRHINFTFEDFFRYSNLGLSGHVELKKSGWGIIFDYIYVDLLKDQTYTKLTLTELALARNISEKLEIIAGGRYFKASAEYRDDPDNYITGEKKWIDPIIGARLSWELTRHFVFSMRADVGGFGAGSKFEWNIIAGFWYQLANMTFMGVYRIWYADYESGSADNLFVYDMTTSGPGLMMIIHF